MEMHQKAIWDMESLEALPWGGAAAQAQAGAEAATPTEGKLWSAQRPRWWVAPNHPPGRQAHTRESNSPGAWARCSQGPELSQAGGVV